MSQPHRYLLICASTMLLAARAHGGCPALKDLDVPVMLMNFQGPMIPSKLAEQLALDFVQARYAPSGIFKATEPAEVVDLGDRWAITFKNALFDSSIPLTSRLQVRQLVLEICKSNAAISRIG